MNKKYTLNDDYLIYLKKSLELKTDKAKLSALEYSKKIFPEFICSFLEEEIIPTLESDDLKTKLIYEYPKLQTKIISSLQSDELKIAHLIITKDKADVVASFKDDELKTKYLDYLTNDYDKTYVIKSFKTDELKIKYIDILTDDIYKESIIKTFASEKNKFMLLLCTPVLSLKKQILPLIKDENLKAQAIEIIKNFETQSKELLKNKEVYDPKYYDVLIESTNLTNFDKEKESEITIGIELEAFGGNADIIRNNNDKILGRWISKTDGSLPSNSVEIISPILKYNEKDMKELYIVCNFMKENNLTTDSSCSTHIHIGRTILGTKEKWKNLYEIYTTMEKELYLLANERNSLPRLGVQKFAKPISQNFKTALEEGHIFIKDDDDLDLVIKNLQYFVQCDEDEKERRYYGLNILNIFNSKGKKDTIEFRISNGTLEEEEVHQNIKLFMGIILLSNNLKDQNIINTLKQKQNIEKVDYFLSLIFNNKEDIKYFQNRYEENTNLLNKISLDSILGIKVGKKWII